MTGEPLLRVEHLRKYYPLTQGVLLAMTLGEVKAVDDISFAIAAGRTLGLVGESGCGKTTTSKMILNLEQPTSGQVLLDGRPIHGLHGKALREYRTLVQAVFQDPWSSLNPRMTAGRIIAASANFWSMSACEPSRRRSIRTSSAAGSASASRWPEHWRRGHG
jgi:ABC-type oligopeptide transport system ATPase subunit